jgi:hypothetical protein
MSDVPELLREWDARLRRDISRFDRLAPETRRAGTVLREPATEEAIAAAEARLGVRLPPTYRAFLLTSNGAHASTIGPERQYEDETPRHGFVPVQEVERFDATEAGRFLIGIWTEHAPFRDPERDTPPQGDARTVVSYYAPMREALLISSPFDVYQDLLVPRAGSEEWEVWQLARDGADAWRSFAAFLRDQLARPDERPKPELAEEYVARVREGKPYWLLALAEIGDPRVGELAFGTLLDPTVREFDKRSWARPLGLLGDPAFVPDLRRAYDQARLYALRIELLQALRLCGDPDLGATLRAIAGDPGDEAHAYAVRQLERR